MARVNKTHVVEDPFDDELNDVKNFESPGAGAGVRGGSIMRRPNAYTVQ